MDGNRRPCIYVKNCPETRPTCLSFLVKWCSKIENVPLLPFLTPFQINPIFRFYVLSNNQVSTNRFADVTNFTSKEGIMLHEKNSLALEKSTPALIHSIV